MNSLSVARAWLLGLCLIAPGVHALTCSNASIVSSNPDSAYSINADDTVTHKPTGLVWKRCSEGQSWDGSTCSGTASSHTWAQALTGAKSSSFAGQSDWRLPNLKELRSLVEECRVSPAINDSVFPGTPSSFFWSGSPSAGDSYYAWFVSFSSGDAYNGPNRSSNNLVRLVRGGQLFGPFGLSFSKTGVGQVSSSTSPGVDCGAVCGSYPAGTMLTLSAKPAANFIRWSGACTSAGTAPTCTLTMDASKEVSASFIDTPFVSGLPESLTFALQNLGSNSASQSLTLRNTGNLPLTISSIATTGDFAVTHNCTDSLAAGASCQLNVSFAPPAVGARSGSLTIGSNAPGSPHSVALSGTGQGGVLSVSPSSMSFSGTNTGTVSGAKSVTLSNVGGAAVNFGSLVVSGEFARTTTCGSVLAQGTSCSVSVYFVPVSVGALTGSLLIPSDSPGNPNSVALSGSGVATAMVSLSPGTLSMTGQAVGSSSAPQTVTLRNTGTGNLGLSSVSAIGDFAVTHDCGVGLSAGASCSLSIIFTPTITGARSGSVTVNSNLGTARVYLIGNGVFLPQVIGRISLNPSTLKVGESATLSASGGASGNAVTFGTTTPLVCSVVGGFLTGRAGGVCSITANQAGNATYAEATTVTQNITVGQASQTIGAISFTPTTLAVGGTAVVSATATSGLGITFSSSTTTICSVSGSTVTAIAAGTCAVAANQAGNANFSAAPQVLQNISVSQTSQSIGNITFSPPTLSVGLASAVSATASSSLPVTFSSNTPTICAVSGRTVIALEVGTCTIAANQNGNANFAAAPQVTQNISVAQATGNALVDLKDIAQIDAGPEYTCAVTNEGGVKCWGENSHGQLGDGTKSFRSTATNVHGLASGVLAVAVGRGSSKVAHTCALTTTGAVKCWGANESGQLGDGTTVERLTPVDVVGMSGGVLAIASGGQHTCAVMMGGGVKCWGDNLLGQLGDGTQTQRLTPVTVVGLNEPIVTISTSFKHTCAISSLGGAFCWGSNESGELGDGTWINRSVPVSVSSLSSGTLAISAGGVGRQSPLGYMMGGLGTCAVTTSGVAKCWGSGQGGGHLTPYEVAGLTDGVASISSGGSDFHYPSGFSFTFDSHTCVLTNNGQVKCWGGNYGGQLGCSFYSGSPVEVLGLFSPSRQVSAGGGHTCALSIEGTVQCWGGGSRFQATDPPSCTAKSVMVTASGLTPQTIVFNGPTSVAIGGTADVIATGGDSGNSLVINSLTPTICSITDTTVSGLVGGLCVIAANQLGNDFYEQASQVKLKLRVGDPVAQSIVFGASPSLFVGGTAKLDAAATSGLPLTFGSNTPSICSISGDTVSGIAVGTCTVAADQAGDQVYARAPQTTQNIVVTATAPTNPARLINISTRGQVSTGDGVMIGGFIISGAANKKVLIRAIGPNLANFGISGTLPDPKLELFEGPTLIGSNDNWQTQSIPADVADITATGLAPANVAESALLVTLKPGVAYTAVVTGVNFPSGVGIVEVFEADHPEYQLINISTRGRVETGEGVMIGGFIIQGDTPKTVLIRAVGPNLANFGVSGVLADPTMEIYRSSDGVKIASNDDWQTQTIAADVSAITATGLPPADPRESAILLTLPPGAYTAVVSGKDGGTGVGIVEVFAR